MLDPTLLRSQLAETAARLQATRGFALDVAAFERLEAERKTILVRTQELQNLRNTRSKAIGQAKAKGEDASAILAEVAGIGDELKASEARLDEIRAEIDAIASGIPNLPDPSVPAGADDVVRRADELGINLCLRDADHVSVSCDETTTPEIVAAVLEAFGTDRVHRGSSGLAGAVRR